MKTVEIDNKEMIEEIIKACKICFLGMIDLEGDPYVLPMNFAYHEGVVYLHSAPDGGLMDIIQKNSKVCITFNDGEELVHQHPNVACSYRMRSRSVVCKGAVSFIEDLEEKREILNLMMVHYIGKEFKYSDPAVKNVKIWAVPIDKVTAKEFAAPHDRPNPVVRGK